MRLSSIQSKIMLRVGVAMTCVFLIFLGWNFSSVYVNKRNKLRDRAEGLVQMEAEMLASSMWDMSNNKIKNDLNALSSANDFKSAVIIDPSNNVIHQVDRDVPPLDLWFLEDYTTSRAIFYRERPYPEYLGTIYITLSANSIIREVNNVLFNSIIYFCILLIVTLVIIYFFLKSIVLSPLKRLAEAAGVIATGNFSERLTITTEDEIGTVSVAFNNMAHELEAVYDNIESRAEERARALEQSQIAQRAAETANEVKSRFLANMTHELRTPLNGIIGFTEMLLEDVKDEQITTDLKKIYYSAKDLLKIINNILDFSTIESGINCIHAENFDLNALLHSVIHDLKEDAEYNNNKLILKTETNALMMYSDLLKVRQCIYNVVNNAVKFTRNGTITITLRDIIELQGSHYIITIADTGIGIDPTYLPLMFQPFNQEDNSRTRKFGGAGMGLAVTKRYCDMLRAKIEVESVVNHGSTFTLKFPHRIQNSNKDR